MLGLTFKEDGPDLGNSKVVNVIERLKWIGHEVTIHDPLADPQEAAHEYGLQLDAAALDRRYDAVIAAVPHARYRGWNGEDIARIVESGGLVADIKGIRRAVELPPDLRRWQLFTTRRQGNCSNGWAFYRVRTVPRSPIVP